MLSIRFPLKVTVKAFALAVALTLAGGVSIVDAHIGGKDMHEAEVTSPADPVLEVAAGKDMKEAGGEYIPGIPS